MNITTGITDDKHLSVSIFILLLIKSLVIAINEIARITITEEGVTTPACFLSKIIEIEKNTTSNPVAVQPVTIPPKKLTRQNKYKLYLFLNIEFSIVQSNDCKRYNFVF